MVTSPPALCAPDAAILTSFLLKEPFLLLPAKASILGTSDIPLISGPLVGYSG